MHEENIIDLMDAVDCFEDSLIINKLRWSERAHFEDIISCLKAAISYHERNGEFGTYADLVEAVTKGTPVYRNHLGYGSSISFVLFDNFVSFMQDFCEMVIMPAIKAKRLLLQKLNKKFETSFNTVASPLIFDSKGEAYVPIEKQLPSKSDDQFVILKHPSSKKYEWDDSPKVSLMYNNGRVEDLKVSFIGYRVIGYRVKVTDGINRINFKGKPLESFSIIWSDTLSCS